MRIGLDIDGVIANFNEPLFKAYLKHDKTLRNKGVINKNTYIRGMFDWSRKEEELFYESIIEKLVKNLKPIKDAKKYIDKLKEDEHEIYIITGRGNGEYKNPLKMTTKWLKKHKIKYDKLILTNAYDHHAKARVCKENKVDLVVEDSISTTKDLMSNKIQVLFMDNGYNKTDELKERYYSWKDIYKKIESMNKKHIILDTDTFNETDDQFAIAYLLKNRKNFILDAVTIAPFQKKNKINTKESIDLSYKEAKKVFELCKEESDGLIYKGAEGYIKDGYNKSNEAVDKIIEVCLKNDKTYILGIAAITNIALAIKYEPKIIDKIELIWLGGHSIINDDNKNEANFKDVEAVKMIFKSNVKLTIIPCKPVASNLSTTMHELKNEIYGKNKLCNFLYRTFKDYTKRKDKGRWPLWDIAVIAYMINKDWFEQFETNCPDIKDDLSYKVNSKNRKVAFINNLNYDAIYKDLFEKLRK